MPDKQTWEELREKFFKECSKEKLVHYPFDYEQICSLNANDIFEWFKKELAGINTPEPSLPIKEVK